MPASEAVKMHHVASIPSLFFGFVFGIFMTSSMSERRNWKETKKISKENRENELNKYRQERYNNSVREIRIKTKVLSKWRFVDLENNQTYKYQNGHFVLIDWERD